MHKKETVQRRAYPAFFTVRGSFPVKPLSCFQARGVSIVSMGKDLFDSFPEVKSVIDDADACLREILL
jgi:hypothetical protein